MLIPSGTIVHLFHFGKAVITDIEIDGNGELVYVVTTQAGDSMTLTSAYLKKVMA